MNPHLASSCPHVVDVTRTGEDRRFFLRGGGVTAELTMLVFRDSYLEVRRRILRQQLMSTASTP
jgi:hypothetical protein